MIGRDLDFDLHNAIQDLIAGGLLEENAIRIARLELSSTMAMTRLFLHNRCCTTLS
jgi:hypothetical protein